MSAGNDNIVTITDELKFCLVYLEMQKIRYGDALKYTVDISGENSTLFIPAFSLQLLTENVIKHNALTNAVRNVSQYFARKLIVSLSLPFSEKIIVSKEKVTLFLNWLSGK